MSFEIENGVLIKYRNKKDITEVIIPDGVAGTGSEAFSCCESLIDINIPNSVKYIGEGAFPEGAHLIKAKVSI